MGLIQKPYIGIPPNKNHPLSQGLVSCWVENEKTGGKVFDLSGNNNHGTIHGAEWVANGLDFNANDYMTTSLTGFDRTKGTIVISVKLDSLYDYQWLFSEQGTGNNNNEIEIYVESTGNVRMIVWGGTTVNEGTAPTISAGEHNILAMSWNSASVCNYLNGTITGACDSSVTLPTAVASTAYFGSRSALDYWIDGTIEYAYIYNRALSADEIAWLNREPYAMFQYPSLVELFADTGAPIYISAGADALILTENSATVNAEISTSAGVDALVLTENVADINLNVNVSAGVDALIIAESATNINTEVSISADIDALTLTEYQAVVAVDEAIEVIADIDALTLTEYAATVNAEVSISAEIDILALTENAATVNAETDINASIDTLTLSLFTADIKINIDIQATLEALVIAEYSASVATGAGSTKFISEQLGLNSIQGLF